MPINMDNHDKEKNPENHEDNPEHPSRDPDCVYDTIEEENISSSGTQQDLIKMIDHEFSIIGQMSWENTNILLDFALECIITHQLEMEYSFKVLEIIENLLRNSLTQIKEKCFQLLIMFQTFQDVQIKTKAQQIFEEFSHLEENHEIIFNLLSRHLNQKDNKKLKNYDQFEEVLIERPSEIGEIHEKLNQKNILTIYGQSGTGKTTLALQYCQYYNDFYYIIYQLNSESFKKDLMGLADILEVEEASEEEIQLKLRSGTIKGNILILIDNQKNYDEIKRFYVELKNIKYLITSREEIWDDKYEIGPISKIDSENMLLSKCQSGQEKLVNELLKAVKYWGIGIRLCIIWLENDLDINEILLENLESEENIKKTIEIVFNELSEEALYCIELIGLCRAKNIPEIMLQTIIEDQFNQQAWELVKNELFNRYLVDIETNKQVWCVHDLIYDAILLRGQTRNCREAALKHYSEYFNIDQSIHSNKRAVNIVTNLMSHVENLLNSSEISFENELCVSINLAACYAYLTYEHIKLSKLLTRIENYFTACGYSKIKSILLDKLGNVYASKADFSNAENCFLKCIENEEQQIPKNNLHLATYLNNLGSLYQSKGDYLKAGNTMMKGLEIQQELYPNNSPNLLSSFNNLGLLFKKVGDYTKAEHFYLKALGICQESLSNDLSTTATIFNNLGGLYCDKKDYIKSEECYLKCLNIQKKVLQNNHPNLAATLCNLGNVYQILGDFKKAEGLFLRCLEIYQEIYPNNHPSVATSFNNLGLFYKEKGEFNKAAEYYFKCLQIQQEVLPSNHPDLATTLSNLGEVYKLIGDLHQAEKCYLLCLNIQKEVLPKYHPYLAATFDKLGILYTLIGDLTKAENYLLINLDINQKLFPGNHPILARSLRDLAHLYKLKGDNAKAENLYLISLQIFQQSFPINDKNLMMSYTDMLFFYLSIKEYTKAENIALIIASIEQQGLNDNNPKLAKSFQKLGAFYRMTGDFLKAENYFLKSIQINEQILPNENLDLAESFEEIGLLYMNKGEFSNAEVYLLKCLNIKQTVLSIDNQSLVAIYKILTEFYKNTGDCQKSEEFASRIV